ncbi:MAG: type II/IV secretion system ATPase subunit [Candidatus Aenigmarchaeota archaeon]|nr:type II/IV secretion system ATPase subunit [Candidatus Aenigmarchaeota archaeon]
MVNLKLQSLLGSMQKRRKSESNYPSFSVLPQGIVEMNQPRQADVASQRPYTFIYPLIRPYCHVQINEGNYIVTEPQLSDEEKKLFSKIKRALMQILDVSPSAVKNEQALLKMLEEKFRQILEDFSVQVTNDLYLKMMYYVYRDFMGLNEAEPLLRDPFIEDISCDGIGINIYIVHRRFGHLRTNIIFEDEEKLKDMVVKLAEKCGRYISHAEPLMDGTLPDGTRVQATLAKDVTTRGPSFSIRKFPERPYTPLDIIEFNTADEKMLAYLWQLVEGGANILIIGATASGKTSMLNSIAFFVPPSAKIVSIEDTREVNVLHENWLPAVVRTSFSGTTVGEVTMFELLKESFRQNPNYLIVGEVRGEEASVMFQAMASGMATMSTMHAGSPDDALKRLQLPPISIPPSMIETLDAIILMTKATEKDSNSRRIRSIAEVGKNGIINEVFSWDPVSDSFIMKGDSAVLKKIGAEKGISEGMVKESVEKKETILKSLRGSKMQWKEVAERISEHYAGRSAAKEGLKAAEQRAEEPAKTGEEQATSSNEDSGEKNEGT